jgi:hypothetical protein
MGSWQLPISGIYHEESHSSSISIFISSYLDKPRLRPDPYEDGGFDSF